MVTVRINLHWRIGIQRVVLTYILFLLARATSTIHVHHKRAQQDIYPPKASSPLQVSVCLYANTSMANTAL